MKSSAWALALALALSCLACEQQTLQPAARLRGALDTIVAGTGDRFMYVAGGVFGVLYVMDLHKGNFDVSRQTPGGEFIRAPNMFFPLEIPVGRNPTALARSENGRYVLALSGSDNKVHLVEADAMQVVKDAAGNQLFVEGVGRGGSAIQRSPKRVEVFTESDPTLVDASRHIERFYVASPIDQSVHTLDLLVDNDGALLAFTPGATIPNTGAISRLALSEDGTYIFGADASSPFVHRIDTTTFQVAHIDVGGPSLDVAAITLPNGGPSWLYVARPDTLSVEVFGQQSGDRLDTNPAFAPLVPEADTFTGIYVGRVPARLQVVPQTAVANCIIDPMIFADSTPFMLVATDDGTVFFVDAEENKLMSLTHCMEAAPSAIINDSGATAKVLDEVGQQSRELKLLAPCPTVASDRRRQICVNGAFLTTGWVPEMTFTFVWEGVLPGLLRSNGGGTIGADGVSLSDPGVDFSVMDVRPGDRLIIHTPPAPVASCEEAYGTGLDRTLRELTIQARVIDEAGQRIVFEVPSSKPPLSDCFGQLASGELSYEIRAQGAYVVSRTIAGGVSEQLGRLQPGETWPPAGSEPALVFTMASLPEGVTPVRDDTYTLLAHAPFTPMVGGLVNPGLSAVSPLPVPAGRIPTSISSAFVGAAKNEQTGRPTTFTALVSFATDLLVQFIPTASIGANQATGVVVR